ncbi:MAG: F0F1 ATP synthase subunit A [Campylobacterota bacterium]
MEGIFTFLGMISGSHAFILLGHVVLTVLVIAVIVKAATKNMKVVPTGAQNVLEAYMQGVLAMGRDVVGEKYSRKYIPLIATLGVMIFVSNIIGIIPGFEAPTANINFTLPLALIVFFYYNFEGIRKNGVVDYFAHFSGPVKWLAPLMFPIEIISHLSRIISLSFRLFGNVRGDDLFLWVLIMLVPFIVPLPAYVLLTFMAFLQAFIFMMLTYVYLAGAVLLHEESH